MIDAFHLEVGLEDVPVRNLVGRDDAAGGNPFPGEIDSLGFTQEAPGQRPATALAQNNNHPALAAAVGEQAAVDPVVACVGGPDLATEHGPVHFHLTLEPGLPGLECHRLPQLVHQHEGISGAFAAPPGPRSPPIVLHVQIPRELDRGQTLGGVHEQADRPEQIDEGQLARGEDGAGGDAELPVAGGAFEPAPGAQVVDVQAAAERADRSALRLGPSQPAEAPICGVFPFLVDRPERQGPGGSGKQEMLGHGRLATRNMFPSCSYPTF